MSANTVSGQLDMIAVLLNFDSVCFDKLFVSLNHKHSSVRHNIAGNSCCNTDDIRISDSTTHKVKSSNTLFTYTHRESGVGCENKLRGRLGLNIVLCIFHTCLFVCAEDSSERVGNTLVVFLKELQHVKTEHASALVIGYTSTNKPTVNVAHYKRIALPTVTDGDNVQMAYAG